MGGKPSKGTPADMRLTANKKMASAKMSTSKQMPMKAKPKAK